MLHFSLSFIILLYRRAFVLYYQDLLLNVKLMAFELAGEDRDRRENPVLSRLKIAFFALHKRG